MTASCDSETLKIFSSLVGERLIRVLAKPYPSYSAYSEFVLDFSQGLSITLSLREYEVAQKFEVFVVNASLSNDVNESEEWDCFKFSDFLVSELFVLRRVEWIDSSSEVIQGSVGERAVVQHFECVDSSLNLSGDDVIVDAGVCFMSSRGERLSFHADTFPLVFQFEYSVGISEIPKMQRVPIMAKE